MKSAEYIFKALDEVKQSREKKELQAQQNKSNLYKEYPKLYELDESISSVFKAVMKQVIAGQTPDFAAAEEKSLALQDEKAKFIKDNNIDYSVTTPVFDCSMCEDTGYFKGKICECVKKKATELVYNELNKDVTLSDYTFEKFSLSFYPDKDENGVNPYEIMTKISGFCVKYASEFTLDSENLVFFGKTGLGKTHLCLAIANDVIAKGYNVVYGPISKIIGQIETEHFAGGQEKIALKKVCDCDLLVLDDLGTEFDTSFVLSTVFDIINSRLLNKKPTIINTNLNLVDLKRRYDDRVVSRIIGNYRMLEFFGEDVRTLK